MKSILVLNSGSSSIKFSIFDSIGKELAKLVEGAVEGIGEAAGQQHEAGSFWVKSWLEGKQGEKVVDLEPEVPTLEAAFSLIAKVLQDPQYPRPFAVGHRMVCGGPTVTENQRITPELIDQMERYTSFAPLHTPAAIYIMRQVTKLFSDVPNFVCLDSYFHRNLPEVTRQLPIPAEYSQMGVRRFGAHGISYESIVANLKHDLPSRLIVAHLGNGSSVCAIRDGQSVDTSMGLTPTGGLISGSRTGDIDPGVLLFILRKLGEKAKDTTTAANQLEAIVNKRSGLLGVSELDNDMRSLRKAQSDGNGKASLAIAQFVYVLSKYIGAYIGVLGGVDTLVFTGGIGINDKQTRAEVCARLEAFGIFLDGDKNQQAKGESIISSDKSAAKVRVIPPAEDLMIVEHVMRLVGSS